MNSDFKNTIHCNAIKSLQFIAVHEILHAFQCEECHFWADITGSLSKDVDNKLNVPVTDLT